MPKNCCSKCGQAIKAKRKPAKLSYRSEALPDGSFLWFYGDTVIGAHSMQVTNKTNLLLKRRTERFEKHNTAERNKTATDWLPYHLNPSDYSRYMDLGFTV